MQCLALARCPAWLAVIAVSFLWLAACQSPKPSPEAESPYVVYEEDTSGKSQPLYPFIDYVRAQIAYVDTMPLAIEKIVSLDGRMVDSLLIDRAQFQKLAGQFLEINPNRAEWRPAYEESSYLDLTLNRLTFTITSTRNDVPLQRVDVLLHPETQKVRNLILQKVFTGGDSSVQQTLLWVHNMHFQVVEKIAHTNGRAYTRETRVVWDRPME